MTIVKFLNLIYNVCMEKRLEICSKYKPSGDQPKAIQQLVQGLQNGDENQTLLGITGSGKTFTIANVIEKMQRQTLVIAHNKTLAAQLYNEFKELFPNNAVEYFISYYDFYQPEAYIPRSDTYIEKSATINDEIDRLRHNTTRSLYERNDVIVVASVSCIYGLGLPEQYLSSALKIEVGDEIDRNAFLRELVKIQYNRNDLELTRSTFRPRGEVIEIMPAYEKMVTRISLFGDEVEKIVRINPVSGEIIENLDSTVIFPAVHYLSDENDKEETIALIRQEMKEQVRKFEFENKLIEAQRIEQRTNYDIEMIKEMGYCSGIENYSRIIERRAAGTPPSTLLDYFNDDFLLVIDESHVTIPQLKAMYNGDQARKSVLVDYGFRLPSAKDNRPLKFEEFWGKVGQKIFVSATPADFEKEVSSQLVEQIIRPTGLVDPEIFVKPTLNQVDDLIEEIKKVTKKNERILVTTLTKKMAEDLCDYLQQMGIKVRYLHSEIVSIERVEILRDLRLGVFDVLIGVNLLREGLDIPEVSLVAILDADKEGFLRSETSLIQTIGRAARNADGQVIMYADSVTPSMERAIKETERRRAKQKAYNEEHGIIPQTIKKDVREIIEISTHEGEKSTRRLTRAQREAMIKQLTAEMKAAAKILEFEHAAYLRDKIEKLKEGK